jgi:hypothetical protein
MIDMAKAFLSPALLFATIDRPHAVIQDFHKWQTLKLSTLLFRGSLKKTA